MSQDRPLESQRVLVVEDQYYLATDLCEWLVAAGATVIGPVPDAERACVLIQEQSPDSAVVDINLGQGPTFAVATELAKRRIPFVFATGYDRGAIPPEFESRTRLEKPFKSKDLVAAIQAVGTAPE